MAWHNVLTTHRIWMFIKLLIILWQHGEAGCSASWCAGGTRRLCWGATMGRTHQSLPHQNDTSTLRNIRWCWNAGSPRTTGTHWTWCCSTWIQQKGCNRVVLTVLAHRLLLSWTKCHMSHDTGYDKYLIDMEIARFSYHCLCILQKKREMYWQTAC